MKFHKPSNQLLFLFFFIGFFLTVFSQNKYQIKPIPKWVNQVSIEKNDSILEEGSSIYLFADYQDNLNEQVRYRHFAIKVLNSEGVQEMSDVSVEFDPSYQKLILHEVSVIRNGKKINKLLNSEIQTIHVETDAERLIYNGTLSTILHLNDIRKDDVIEYSYSLKGQNPIYKGNYSSTYYHQFTFPILSIYNRVISKKELDYKLFVNATEPNITRNGDSFEYVWDVDGSDFLIYDNNTPAWYNPQKRISLSTYKSWSDVTKWALSLYSYDEINCSQLISNFDSLSESQKINAIIKFVQDEIRYLGFENGINAFKPHSSKFVLKQRYGDCKDKSQLLVSMLRSEGIEAYPMLVHSTDKNEIKNNLPSPGSFDHCVVNFLYEDKNYFIDPTINNQGGDIYNIYFPDYELGLILKDSTTELFEIPNNNKNVIDITENFVLDSVNGSATYKITTRYEGKSADGYRSNFATSTKENIKKDYLEFYANLYPNIEAVSAPIIVSDDRLYSNEFVTEENYLIKDFWIPSEDSTFIYCEVQPIVLESILNSPSTANRKMPFYIGTNVSYFQVTDVELPEDWTIQNTKFSISEEGYNYTNKINYDDNAVKIINNYSRSINYLTPENTQSYIDDHDKILGELPYNFTYNKSIQESSSEISIISVVIGLFGLIIGLILALKLYEEYNPNPRKPNILHQESGIGGWLVLPAIGLCLYPFIVIIELIQNDFFSSAIWVGAESIENSLFVKIFISFELVTNVLLIVYSSLLILLLFKKRTSLPRLISILYILNFGVQILDLVLSNQVLPEELIGDNSEIYRNIVQNFFSACIWIPYFNISKRVRNTFTIKHPNQIEKSLDITIDDLKDDS